MRVRVKTIFVLRKPAPSRRMSSWDDDDFEPDLRGATLGDDTLGDGNSATPPPGDDSALNEGEDGGNVGIGVKTQISFNIPEYGKAHPHPPPQLCLLRW